jgi:exodeoxyribonuclease V gamma subunit
MPLAANQRAAETGLAIYRASRLEALIEPLCTLMQAAAPAHALAPHEIIVAHPGMLKWLSRALARSAGTRGISANLRIELPSEWLDRLAVRVLGEEAVALRPYRRDVLRWLVLDELGTQDDMRLAAFLDDGVGDAALRRFQLADRVAGIYTRYLVYRPDWLGDWAAPGRSPSTAAAMDGRERPGRGPSPRNFLAPLWRRLRTRIGQPHRGEMLRRLVAALDRDDLRLAAQPLHVFGVAHLAPSELDVLRAVAQRRLVVLYVPDPCREHWGGLRSGRAQLLELARTDPDGTRTQAAFLAQDHPLLASWGRLGQQFLLALEDSAARIDERHWQDLHDARADNRLRRLQESFRQLQPELLTCPASWEPARADASLRVHACHTRLRELEVLRDALLALRRNDTTIKPSDIAVMMPDVHAYLPLLPTVFGEAARHDGPLPYHCFDVAVARAHPLFAALRQLLDLPRSRIAAPQVVDLLGIPQIARRFGLDAGEIDTLAGWLRTSRVAWGLDANFRERFDVPPIAEHTFAWAMDRLLAGYVFGAAGAAVDLADGSRIAPVEGVRGPQAALVGALDALLVELQAWCDLAAAPRRASEWAQALEMRLDASFRIDPTDAQAREARALLLRFVRAIATEPADSGLDPLLDFAVVRDVLLRRLDGVPERQRFLLGGVTFCGMVPQRSIPFRVVAVLGLDDGQFPRRGGGAELDLMATHRRLGDRDTRSDDRYLFLETVMSARDALHLSFIGEGVRDGLPRNPAAPLAELMTALDAESVDDATAAADATAVEGRRRPWLVRHPLQPFDARYFDASDPALFSFRGEFAAMRREPSDAAVDTAFVGASPSATADSPRAVALELRGLLAYFKDPAKQVLANGLNLRLDAVDDDHLRDSEPLEARVEAIDRVARRLFFDAVAEADPAVPDAPPDWLRLTGMLPPGRVGVEAYAKERETALGLVAVASRHALFAGGLPPARTIAIEQPLVLRGGRALLRGELRRVFEKDGALWVMECYPLGVNRKELDFKQRIPFFIEWALLRLGAGAEQAVHACPIVPARCEDGWQHRFDDWQRAFEHAGSAASGMLDELARRIGHLVDFWHIGQHEPQWYFPGTSWAVVNDGPDKARERWLGTRSNKGERDYAPGYARLLAGEREFAEGADLHALLRNAQRLSALIDLQRPLAEDP